MTEQLVGVFTGRAHAAKQSAVLAAAHNDIWLAGFCARRAVEALETVNQLRLQAPIGEAQEKDRCS